MSDMQRNRGIVKRISTRENAKDVFKQLIKDGKVEEKWCDVDEDGSPIYIDSEDYSVIDGCIFDITGAPDERDPSDDDVNEAVRLNDTDYRVHAYFYNGGASFEEMLEESIPLADKAYEKTSDPKTIIAKALAEAKVTQLEAFVIVQEIFTEQEQK